MDFEKFAINITKIANMKPTHCFEIIKEITEGTDRIKIKKLVSTASGMFCLVEDTFDGQVYDLEIKPSRIAQKV